jgi:hypothetical protein
MDIDVVITFDPAKNRWHATDNPIVLKPGTTRINWTIKLTEPTGDITFGNQPDFRGISFNNHDWPGSLPVGTQKLWTTEITDDLPPFSDTARFHYTVNALYTPSGAVVAEQKSWDPEVDEEADPPPPIRGGDAA